jgi:ATP-dependent protease ClpP protease subunit
MTTPLTTGKGYVLAAAEDGAPSATLYLYDVFGTDMFGGVAARQVVDDLAALGPVETLDVRVNSAGGDVFEGIAVYNALKRFPAKVTVHVDGIAASIASLVALAGDKTLIADNAMVMVHRPWTAVVGDGEEMRRTADTLDKAWQAMLTTYQSRTGRRAASIAKQVTDAGGEWWMTAEDAVAAGFADAVVKAEKAPQVFGLHRFHKVPARLAASAGDAAATTPVPRVASIEAPRVEVAPREGTPQSVRRRVLDLLRLGS